MAIRFKYAGVQYTVDTPEEAASLRRLLIAQDEEDAMTRAREKVFAQFEPQGVQSVMRMIDQQARDEMETSWTPSRFMQFMERLGKLQTAVLAALVNDGQVSDEALRRKLNVGGNQALAGVLSGISKQAAALGIPARAIFSFENLRHAGKRRSTYRVAEKFQQIAHEMNWPPLHLQ